jgi:DHA3 family macrolide efflux protein-like MFS transporter
MLKRAETKARELEERVPPVLTNQGFLHLWLAQIISQTAQNAILYALIIRVIDLTGSTATTSGVVLAFVVPTVVFGMFSGVLVDRWSKRRILIITNAGRAIAALAFFFGRDHVWALYTITVFFASFSQLFTTTNAASIPYMVSRQQLISANSLFSLGFTIAQITGLIFLAPLIIKTTGFAQLFIIAAIAFLVATLLARWLPPIGRDGEQEVDGVLPGRAELRGAISELVKALSALRADPLAYLAMAHITISSTLVLIFAVLVPGYMQEVLHRRPEDAVAVFAPVAFGALFGLRAVPWIVPRLGHTKTVAVGLFGLAICLAAFGSVEVIADALERTDRFNPFGTEQIFGQSILVSITVLVAGPMGVFYALLNAPAQTLLHERTPTEMRGRIFASQMVLANGVALIPLVVVGGIADLYGVSRVVLAIAVLIGLAGALSLYLEQRWLHGRPPNSGGSSPEWAAPHQAVSGSIDTT